MIMGFPNKYDSWPGILSVCVIVRSYGTKVFYKLHYFYGIIITFKLRHCQSNHNSSFNNLCDTLMLPPDVRSNAPVRLKVKFSKAMM